MKNLYDTMNLADGHGGVDVCRAFHFLGCNEKELAELLGLKNEVTGSIFLKKAFKKRYISAVGHLMNGLEYVESSICHKLLENLFSSSNFDKSTIPIQDHSIFNFK